VLDKPNGNIDTLSKRLAFIRTWTYVSQRKDWVEDAKHWRGQARDVEDRLSDALHDALTQRFVDRRTSVLMRRLKEKESLVAELNSDGEVRVEDQFVGKLQGFRFQLDPNATAEEAKKLRATAMAALKPEFSLRSDRFYNAPDTEIDFTEQGGLMWGEHAVGKLVKGADVLSPQIEPFVDEEAGADVIEKVRRRLSHWVDRKVAALFEPLIGLRDDEGLTGLARGVAFQIVESLGIIPRSVVAQDVKNLEQDQRGLLRKNGVRFGQFTIFQPALLKPAPTRLRLVLWSLMEDLSEFPEAPPPGLVTVPALKGAPRGYYSRAGYRLSGERAIRIDMLERLADLIRGQNTREGFEATADMLSISGLTLEQFADLMQGMGYAAEKGERVKVKVAGVKAEAKAEAAPTPTPEAEAEVLKPEQPKAEGEDAKTKEPVSDAPSEETPAPEAAKEEVVINPETGEPEQEVFYTFRWQGRRVQQGGQERNRPAGKPQGRRNQKPKGKKQERPKKEMSARPPKKEKAIDPDNPFAALMALKDKS